MNEYELNNGIIYNSTSNLLLDSSQSLIEINSKIPITFKLYNDVYLPKNCKIEILETKLNYNTDNIEKEILINGRSVNSSNSSLNDSINIKEDYINLPKDDCNKILFSVVECLKLDINLILHFKAIVHTDDCRKLYMESTGEFKDSIETILMTKCCFPYKKLDVDKSFMEINNYLSPIINPDYIFLSPLFDCQSNINSLLGKAFINYELMLDITCYKKVRKNLYV